VEIRLHEGVVIRARAAEWGILPNKIGILGVSAGGHLAALASTHFDAGTPTAADPMDRVSSRPDFTVLVHSVVTMMDKRAHEGSRTNLLGEHPDTSLLRMTSGDRMVTAQTPPAFIVHTDGDTGVPAENGVMYYLALRKAGVKGEMHIFQDGEHGKALDRRMRAFAWLSLMGTWMHANGW